MTISKLTDLEFIVLACDGIFDVMNNTEVIKFVRSRLAQRIHPKEVIFNPHSTLFHPNFTKGNFTLTLISSKIFRLPRG